MSNIQLSNEENYFIVKREEIKNTLTLPTKSFLQKSYDFKKITVLKNDPNFVLLIAGWCVQTSTLMQIKNPIDQFVKKDIFKMLTGYWSILTFEELIKAFELERFSVYEEKTEHYQLFDTAYISAILKKYTKWKQEQKKQLNINAPMEEIKLTPAEIESKTINGINLKYQEFLKNNDIEEPFSWIFKELIERGLIKMPNANTPKLSIYFDNKLLEAKEQILKESKNFVSSDKKERQTNKEILESIISESFNQEAKTKIEIRAKKLVLIDFFKKQIELQKQNIL